MGSPTSARQFVSTARRIGQACGIVLLSVSGFATEGFAQSLDAGWRAETELYLTGMTNYQKNGRSSASIDNLAATAELLFLSDTRPWYVSLFANYKFSTDGHYLDNINLGALLKYEWYEWDATTYVFVNQSSETPDTWFHAGRVRYRVAENHKLGVETTVPFKDPDSLELMLVYYGEISDSISLTVAAGPGMGEVPDFNARLELTWQIH
jgi:hypothetical protein